MKTITSITLCGLFLASNAFAQQQTSEKEVLVSVSGIAKEEADRPKVQIAILLDSSGSMRGLINQARTQLWEIVNTFIDAKVDGVVPFVEVALYAHGESNQGELKDYIRQIQPLTRDLDQISKGLFAIQTNGREEYCGTAIMRAAIFIAGNETIHQGSIATQDACKKAIEKGVIVNTIFCGNESAGLKLGWKEASSIADGKFAVINQNKQMVHIDTPFDDKLLELNKKLNATYITFNKIGTAKKELQEEVDIQNSTANKSAMMSRV